MTSTTHAGPTTVQTAEMVLAAVGFQLGLARLLARAVESATRLEDRQLVPAQRRPA